MSTNNRAELVEHRSSTARDRLHKLGITDDMIAMYYRIEHNCEDVEDELFISESSGEFVTEVQTFVIEHKLMPFNLNEECRVFGVESDRDSDDSSMDSNVVEDMQMDVNSAVKVPFGVDVDMGLAAAPARDVDVKEGLDTARNEDEHLVEVGEPSINPWVNTALPQDAIVDAVAPVDDEPTIQLSLRLFLDEINNCLHDVYGVFAISDETIKDAYHEVLTLYGDNSAEIDDDIAGLVAQKVVENGNTADLKYYGLKELFSSPFHTIEGVPPLCIHPIDRDGRCCFKTLALLLRIPGGYQQVKNDIINYFIKLGADYTDEGSTDTLDERMQRVSSAEDNTVRSFQEYVNWLRGERSWGGELEIWAASNLYKRAILVTVLKSHRARTHDTGYIANQDGDVILLGKHSLHIPSAGSDKDPIIMFFTSTHFDAALTFSSCIDNQDIDLSNLRDVNSHVHNTLESYQIRGFTLDGGVVRRCKDTDEERVDSKEISGDEALAIELQKEEYATSAPRPIHVNVEPVTHDTNDMASTNKVGEAGAESSNTTKDGFYNEDLSLDPEAAEPAASTKTGSSSNESTEDDKPEDAEESFVLEDGDDMDEEEGAAGTISLIPRAYAMSPQQLEGFKDRLDFSVEFMLIITEKGWGAVTIPYGGCWKDIAHDKMPQLWNSREHATVYLFSNTKKIGLTLDSGKRFKLDKVYSAIQPKPFMPIVMNLDKQDPLSLEVINIQVDKLIKECGMFPGSKDYTTITIQEVIDFSSEKGIPLGLCLSLHVVSLLPDNEPMSFRKRLAAFIAESGTTELLKRHHKPINERSAVHEWLTWDNVEPGGQLHKRAAEASDSLVASLDLTPDEEAHIRVNSIQTTAILTYPGDTVGHEVGLMEEDEWSQFPPCKPLLTSGIIGSKNTVGNIVMVNIVTEPPPGGAYKAESYTDETLKSGFFDIYLPQLQNFIDCDDKVAVKLINYFKVMWKYVERIDWFKERISKTQKWKQIMSHSDANFLVDGLNDVQWLMYLGFKPVSRVKGHVVTLTLRKKGKLRIVHAHRSFCWSLYAGLDLKRSQLDHQSMRTEVATTITIFSQMLSEENSSLVTEKDWGELPVFGNTVVGQAVRNWSLVAFHGSPHLSTFLPKGLMVPIEVLLKHRQVYRSPAHCRTFPGQLRNYEGKFGSRRSEGGIIIDSDYQDALVSDIASNSFFKTEKEAVEQAFNKLKFNRFDNGTEIAFGTLESRVNRLLRSERISGMTEELLRSVWFDYRCELFGVPDPDNYLYFEGYKYYRTTSQFADGTIAFECKCKRWNHCKKRVYLLPDGTVTDRYDNYTNGTAVVVHEHQKTCTNDGTKPKGFKDESKPDFPGSFVDGGYHYTRMKRNTKYDRYICRNKKTMTSKCNCTAAIKWPYWDDEGNVLSEGARVRSGQHDPLLCKPVGTGKKKEKKKSTAKKSSTSKKKAPAKKAKKEAKHTKK